MNRYDRYRVTFEVNAKNIYGATGFLKNYESVKIVEVECLGYGYPPAIDDPGKLRTVEQAGTPCGCGHPSHPGLVCGYPIQISAGKVPCECEG